MMKIYNSGFWIVTKSLSIFLLFIFSSTISFSETNKYRLLLRDNPASSIVVGWNQVTGKAPLVYYGPEDFGAKWGKYPFRHMPDKVNRFKGMTNCFARIDYLKPNTKYYFVIKDENSISQRFWFKTAPDDFNSRLSIVAGGDSRNNREVRKNANLLVSKLKPHLILFGGDMVRSGSDGQWQDWLEDWQLTIANDGRMFPVIVARGNHEKDNDIINHIFDTPSEYIYYSIPVCQKLLRIYTLNTEISIKGKQTEWLEKDLKSHSDDTWKIVQYHKPIRPHVLRKFEGEITYEYWAPLFYKHRVQLVVECDAHTVKTTWPIRPEKTNWKLEGFVRDDERGTVYTGEGCWGAPTRPANDPKMWTRAYGEFNQFKWIFLDKNKIEMRTVKVDNAKNVESLNNGREFEIPKNIDIWQPETGKVVLIYP